MTMLRKLLAPASLTLCALAAMPAHAQVEGRLATVDTTRTIIATTAFQTAYQQVETTYADQIATGRTKSQESQTLLAKFDKNSDTQLDEAEQAAMRKSPDFTKLQTLEQEILGLKNQIDGARIYVLEQIIQQYGSALQDVTTAEKIKIVLEPSGVLFSTPETDISQKVVNALNARVPAVGVVPPVGWQKSLQGEQIYKQVQQFLLYAAQIGQQQQQQQEQQGNTAAPVGR